MAAFLLPWDPVEREGTSLTCLSVRAPAAYSEVKMFSALRFWGQGFSTCHGNAAPYSAMPGAQGLTTWVFDSLLSWQSFPRHLWTDAHYTAGCSSRGGPGPSILLLVLSLLIGWTWATGWNVLCHVWISSWALGTAFVLGTLRWCPLWRMRSLWCRNSGYRSECHRPGETWCATLSWVTLLCNSYGLAWVTQSHWAVAVCRKM